jgi:DNA-binding MarR family transcriptional regulator
MAIMNARKLVLLRYLAQVSDASAADVAAALDIAVPAASMGLLRLVRGGLAGRAWDPQHRTYFYAITPRGQARVNFFAARRL